VVLDPITVTVTVTTDSSRVAEEVGVLMGSIDVAVPEVEDKDAGLIVEFLDPEPVIPPVAPAALMRE